MTRSNRVLLAAVALSACLHLLLLLAVPWPGAGAVNAPAPLPPIEARIVPPPVPPPASVAPKKPKASAQRLARAAPKVQTVPAPRPEAVVPTAEQPDLDPFPPGGEPEPGADSPPTASGEAAPPAVAEAAIEPGPAVEYPLRSARLVFDLYYGSSLTKVGQVVHTWSQDGVHYQVESVAEAIGFVSLFVGGRFVQRSSGTLAGHGLMPSEYRAEATARERSQRVRFDWARHKLTLADEGAARTIELPKGAQDPLSVVHQLWFLQPIPGVARLDIATGRRLYEQVYRAVGETEFETPIGMVRAVHLSRRDADGERMDVWLDLDRDLLPARIHFVDRKGLVLEQVIREARVEVAAAR